MRNILMTVMMLAVVAFLFVTIVTNTGGLRDGITNQGTSATQQIEALKPGP